MGVRELVRDLVQEREREQTEQGALSQEAERNALRVSAAAVLQAAIQRSEARCGFAAMVRAQSCLVGECRALGPCASFATMRGASTVLQAIVRRRFQADALGEAASRECEEQARAARTLAASVRGVLATNRYLNHGRMVISAQHLQARLRRRAAMLVYIARVKALEAHQAERDAHAAEAQLDAQVRGIATLQAAVRGARARRDLCTTLLSGTVLAAVSRRAAQHGRLLEQRGVAGHLQALLWRRDARARHAQLRTGTLALQAAVRRTGAAHVLVQQRAEESARDRQAQQAQQAQLRTLGVLLIRFVSMVSVRTGHVRVIEAAHALTRMTKRALEQVQLARRRVARAVLWCGAVRASCERAYRGRVEESRMNHEAAQQKAAEADAEAQRRTREEDLRLARALDPRCNTPRRRH